MLPRSVGDSAHNVLHGLPALALAHSDADTVDSNNLIFDPACSAPVQIFEDVLSVNARA